VPLIDTLEHADCGRYALSYDFERGIEKHLCLVRVPN
jgi:hypothetical protein